MGLSPLAMAVRLARTIAKLRDRGTSFGENDYIRLLRVRQANVACCLALRLTQSILEQRERSLRERLFAIVLSFSAMHS